MVSGYSCREGPRVSGGKDEESVEHVLTQTEWRKTYQGGRNGEAVVARIAQLVEGVMVSRNSKR